MYVQSVISKARISREVALAGGILIAIQLSCTRSLGASA